MLTCITCSKQTREDDGEESSRGTPSTKDAVKSLTSQIKDMALKVSGKGKPGEAEGSYKKGQRSYSDFDTMSDAYAQQPAGSTSSTPDWDFTSTGRRPESRFSASVSAQVVVEDEEEPKDWTAQVEPGVQITFVSLPAGGNDLKRIRFSREMFNKWQAQRWWGENYDRIMELYNVQRFNQQAMNTPGRSEDGRESSYSKLGSSMESPAMTPSQNKEWPPTPRYKDSLQGAGSSTGKGGEMSSVEAASRTTTSSRVVSVSNASDIESEWIEEDEPGVYITIRQLLDGTRELRRVRFSREKFGEVHAKHWWETNRDRIQTQYLC
ncbi:protein BREVIS RADIX-like [Salvia splendens]|uniref:protein BREVIS RADIX-like n=1 Tax=Salvia splendens TaxID=180675 RepID=UPI001C27DF96|nr:protein BREVIS RADIX-like [Salvia splendens]XP_042004566.1 protein BREVIS RADIX-like [Salvia splendens]XP_042004567.1 protein BREVIS RADIX-like [Salvia splendens]XP_042004568.1 protein BREVIS RADIX-like [Salvia splendens]